MPESNRQYLTVSELTQLLDLTLQEYVGDVVFLGEVHELSQAQSGHIYLSLKDAESKIRAVVWQSTARKLEFKLEIGQTVLCQAQPNVYNRSGQLQLIVQKIEPYGEGLLYKKFLELKNKLSAEGLFDAERKRKLPLLPKAIGIVSSASGAVVHDIMTRVAERMPSLKTYLIDARVQGIGSVADIVSAIQEFNRLNNVDVIIVARGGGSLEDLWSFNEEAVVRAIFASRIPIVSAVGHETDITLADLVADVRAPTPTAGAEIVVPSKKELSRILDDYQRRLRSTDLWLQPAWQAIDELSTRLKNTVAMLMNNQRAKLNLAESRIRLIEPRQLINSYQEKINNYDSRLVKALSYTKQVKIGKLEMLAGKLESLSPKKVLERGYSVVKMNGQLLKSTSNLKTNQKIDVILSQGQFSALVDKIKD